MDEDVEIDLLQYEVDETSGEMRKTDRPIVDPQEPKNISMSVSLIKAYQECPAQAYGRITRQPQNKGVALVNGIAVHEGLEKLVTERKDPKKTFDSVFRYEAEKNGILMTDKDVTSSYASGGICIDNALSENLLGKPMSDGRKFYEHIDPNLTEKLFVVFRNGWRWSGKMDFMHRNPEGELSIQDYKTGKMAPSPYDLKHDIQFSVYPWAAQLDEKFSTYGEWAKRSVWLHLRGKTIEKTDTGATSRKKGAKKQFAFSTTRTPEEVEQHFVETIDPIVEAMAEGKWRRDRKSCSWCSFFDKDKQQCRVEIPLDGKGRLERAGDEQAKVKAQNALPLFSEGQLAESTNGKLKPYA